MSDLEHLDEIARDAWNGNYERVAVLSKSERLYVALASGRVHELAPEDSIPYAVDRVGPEWMEHMVKVWRATPQPTNSPVTNTMNDDAKALAFYHAAFRKEAPPYVPARIRLLSDVYGDPPFRGAGASAGEHDCQSNRWGAIAVRDREGKLLGIKPSEYEPIAWRANPIDSTFVAAQGQEGRNGHRIEETIC